MNRSRLALGLLVASAALAAALPAGASQSERTVEKAYRGPSEIEIGNVVIQFGPIRVSSDQVAGGLRFKARADERRVDFEIVDETGQPVQGHVEQIMKRGNKLLGHFCGSTENPFRIKPGKPLIVYPGNAACGGGSIGATQGVVAATFSS